MKFWLLLALFTLASAPLLAQAEKPLADPAEEARAVALGYQIRCVVCQSESVNDSQAGMARDMRQLIRAKIVEGWSDRKILDYVQSRYGDFILLRPPVQANTYALWLAPPLFLVLAGGAVAVIIRRRKPERGKS